MSDSNRRICRLCLKNLYNVEFKIIEEITKQMYDMILLKHNVDVYIGNAICKECTIKLQTCAAFKSACLNTEKKILPFINSEKDARLVLKEELELKNVSEDQKICQFCKRLTGVGCYTLLQRENMFIVDMIQKYIPELHLTVNEEIITCQTCLDSLQNFLNFIMDLLDVEEKIMQDLNSTHNQDTFNYVSDPTVIHDVNCRNVNAVKMEEQFTENECVTMKSESAEIVAPGELYIKHEEIEIKSEDSCDDRMLTIYKTLSTWLDKEDDLNCQKNTVQSVNIIITRVTKDSSISSCYNFQDIPQIEIQHKLIFKEKSEHSPNVHPLICQNSLTVNIYRCEICSYETNLKEILKFHMLTHRLPTDIKLYKCEECPYVTDQKRVLKQHMITHKSPSETEIYKCEKCQFESKHQHSLGRHMLTHRSPSEVPTYRCESCPFQSLYEASLIRHVLTHQSRSEIKMYKCLKCSYEAPQKDRLRRHMMVHQHPSEIVMLKCQKCSFETRRREQLRRHELIQHDPSQVTMFNCDKCPYKTKRKDNLQQHMVTHQNRVKNKKLKIYKCDTCDYAAKYKRSFDKHMKTH